MLSFLFVIVAVSHFATYRILTPSKQEHQIGVHHLDQYRHPIIQKAIVISWFHDNNDVGIMNHEHFSPMPVSVISLILSVVNTLTLIPDEWSDGMQRTSTRMMRNSKMSTAYMYLHSLSSKYIALQVTKINWNCSMIS
jgi:hypothetical protein